MSVIGAISANVESVAPLTDPQADLLEAGRAGRRSGVWQQSVFWHGPFDPLRVGQAARLVAARHEVLRTAVAHQPPAPPRQAILRRRGPELRPLDLRRHDPAHVAAEVEAVGTASLNRGFDPAVDPLCRIDLIELPGSTAALVWTSHRLIVDPAGFARLWRDFCDYHERLGRGQAVSSIETEARLRAQAGPRFHDWVRRRQSEPDGSAHWRDLTAGLPGPTQPVALSPDPTAPLGQTLRRGVGADLVERLTGLAEDCRTDLATVLQAAWGIVLQRQLGRSDVAFGRVVSARSKDGPELVAALDWVAPVRLTSRPEDRVADCLAALSDQTAAVGRTRCGWTELGRRSGLGSGWAATWLDLGGPVEPPSAEGSPDDVALVWAPPRQLWPTDLTVGLDRRPGRFALTAQHCPEACSEADANRALAAWEQALIGLAQGPQRLIADIDAADPVELERVRLDFNSVWPSPIQDQLDWSGPPAPLDQPSSGSAPSSSGGSAATRLPAEPDGPASGLGLDHDPAGLIRRWAARVAQDPAAPALIGRRRQVSRGELERAGAAVVQQLLQAGVGPGDRVVVLARRRPELVAVLVGLAGLGAVCLPLDPDQAESVRDDWLAQLEPAAVVLVGLDRSLPAGLTRVEVGPRIWNARPGLIAPPDPAPPSSPAVRPGSVDPDQAGPLGSAGPSRPVARLGSTTVPSHLLLTADPQGRPQGSLVSQEGLVGYALNPALDAIFADDQTRLLSVCDHSSGLFVAEMWAALLRGRPLVLAEEAELADPAGFVELARDGAATVLLATAAGLAGLTSHPGALPGLGRLRRLVLVGPPFPADPPRRLRAATPAEWLVLYAPARTALWVSLGRLDWDRPGLVGRPLGGCRIHLVEEGRLCSIGQIGRVHLAGPALPSGFEPAGSAADPLTDNPFGPGRLHRCDERARWLPDGRLELVF
ncbi:MAG: AMP-binding protein [Propionibacteriaceae bacterium]|jgi:acyl-CoA synthetase (AMP-forming)/AMP-acid ligase II|nr:AMP-binding protein [Propionibacteriaceae bacterium]